MKKLSLITKQLVVIIVALALMAGIGGAAILNYYGTIKNTVEVHQSIILDGQECYPEQEDCMQFDEVWEESPGGERFCFKHYLDNRASVPASVEFETECESNVTKNCEGIETTIYELPMTTKIILENKDKDWKIIEDERQANLSFITVKPTFNWLLSATGMEKETEYALLYYADFDPRFDSWGGNNPGAYIATVTSDNNGNILDSGSKDLNMNIPASPDWNINPSPNYCDYNNGYDDYVHCAGAKFWLVPAEDYNIDLKKVTKWEKDRFLFETDLAVYFDCDLGVEYYLAEMAGEETTEMTIPSRVKTPILTCYDFAIDIKPDTYTITTWVIPQSED